MATAFGRISLSGAARLALLIAIILAANFVAGWMLDALHIDIRPTNEEFVHRIIMTSAAAYAVLLAIPFVPGVEVGLAIIGMLGPQIVLLVYLCTLAGLTLSFSIGRLVPLAWIAAVFAFLNLRRGKTLLDDLAPLDRDARVQFLVGRAPNRLVPFLLRHRYVALAVMLNLPGNFLVGGGGGIAMIAGISRLISLPGFLVTIALAVAPVPLAVLVFDIDLSR